MPQLDFSSFMPQIFWLIFVVVIVYSIIKSLTISSFSKLNWMRPSLIALLSRKTSNLGDTSKLQTVGSQKQQMFTCVSVK